MALEDVGVQFVAAGADVYIDKLGRAHDATTGLYVALGKGDQAASGFEKGFSDVITGALRHVGEIMVDFGIQSAKAIGGFVKDSVGLAGDFEAGMNEFRAVAGKDVDAKGLEQFRDLFITLGKELPVSTSEVEQAATEMVKGGIDPATIAAGGLRQNIQFAAAAMDGDLVEAANVSAKILGGWADINATASDKAAFLTHATDQLTKAANASSVDVHELSLGIFNAQGIAKTAGVSFDDLTTTLAALSPRFASSSEAGNSLKNVIARLQPTTKPAIAAMEGLGLVTEDGKNKFYDAQGSFVGFEQASQILQDSLKGLTDQQKQSVLQTIFGNDAMNAASGLAELGAAGYQKMADALASANGVADNAALKQQGFNTALENAKGSVEALQITIGSALLPVLTDLLNNVIAPAVNTFTDMADAIFGNDDAFNRLSPTAKDIVSVFDTLVADVQEIIGAFDDAGAGSDEFAQRIDDLASDLGAPAGLIKDITLAVQDVVKWFSTASDKSSDLGKEIAALNGIWTQAKKTITDVANGYKDVVDSVLPQIQQFIHDHGAEIQSTFQSAWDKIKDIVRLALQVYDETVPPILHAIAGFIDDHGSEIQKILKGAWDTVSSIINGALETIKTTLKLALDVIHGDWGAAWDDLKHIGETQIEAIKGGIKGFLDIIAGFFNTSLDDIGKTWKDNWDMLVNIVSKIDWAQVGKDVVAGVIDGIERSADSLFTTLKNLASDALRAAKDALGISSPSTAFMPVGQFMVEGIATGMQQTLPLLGGVIDQMTLNLLQNVKHLNDAVRADIEKAVDDMKARLKDAQRALSSLQIGGLQSEASVDRQKLANLDALDELSDKQKAAAEQQLADAEAYARTINDPKQAAEYFKQRSDQIFELGKLTDEINATTDAKERERLIQRYQLVNAAQLAETKAAEMSRSLGSQTQDVIALLQQLLNTSVTAGGQSVSLPGILENPIIAALTNALQQLVNPPAQVGAGAYTGGGTNTTTNTTNLNMPIYTNNSPAAIQQSMAVALAGLL